MTDKLLVAVCLGCAGALIGFAICMRMKRRAEYFGDLDDFLRVFSDSLSFTMDTVPDIMKSYGARTSLLRRQLDECSAAISAGRSAELPSGALTKEERRLVGEVLFGLGTRPATGERNAVENYRRRLAEYGKRAAESYARSGKAAVKLGFLAGLLVAVLCW